MPPRLRFGKVKHAGDPLVALQMIVASSPSIPFIDTIDAWGLCSPSARG
jgi:hypothetical protein